MFKFQTCYLYCIEERAKEVHVYIHADDKLQVKSQRSASIID